MRGGWIEACATVSLGCGYIDIETHSGGKSDCVCIDQRQSGVRRREFSLSDGSSGANATRRARPMPSLHPPTD